MKKKLREIIMEEKKAEGTSSKEKVVFETNKQNRAVLQNVIFPTQNICNVESLYFRRSGATDFILGETSVKLQNSSQIHFDTYFNSFSAGKWFKYTNIKKVYITIKVRGSFQIVLTRKEKRFDDVVFEDLGQYSVSTEKTKEFTFPFEARSNAGMFCFSLISRSKEAVFYSASYSADVSESGIRDIKLGMVICTFKREKYLENNIKSLRETILENKDSLLKDNLEIFISDNGRTLRKEEIETDKIHLFYNKNTGGAGGFTRGLIEIMKIKEESGITHALLTDDDIILEPEAVSRTYALLRVMNEKYLDAFIGGAMLDLERPNIQHESGASWNGGVLESNKSGLDLSHYEACLYNEVEEKCDFNAWWYCAFPTSILSEVNLPLPIFIRGDDIEFGLRNMKHLILMNGICVWHEPFEAKRSSSLFYYITRNLFIDNAIHSLGFNGKTLFKDVRRQIVKEIISYKYSNAEMLMESVLDFLKGVGWLKEQDGEALHKEIMLKGYQFKDAIELEIPFNYPRYEGIVRRPIKEGKIRKAIRVATVNGLFLPAKDDVIVPIETCPINFYRKKRVLNYDLKTGKGFVTEKSFKRSIGSLWALVRLSFAYWRQHKKAIEDFHKNGRELMMLDFWNRYLELDDN